MPISRMLSHAAPAIAKETEDPAKNRKPRRRCVRPTSVKADGMYIVIKPADHHLRSASGLLFATIAIK